jgi:hypothetical protein
MSKKNKSKNQNITKSISPTNIDLLTISQQKQVLELQEQAEITKMLRSTDVNDILKAQKYLANMEKRVMNPTKSFIFPPDDEFYNSLGYKNHPTNTSYTTIRNMARVPHIRAIITTRMDQVAKFSEPTIDEQQIGWTIRRKRSVFDTKKTEVDDKDKRRIEDIIKFLVDNGISGNTWSNDNFEAFLRKVTRDALEIDQMTFECIRNRRGQLVEFLAVDGATFRLAETYDDRDGMDRYRNQYGFEPINGYYPSYVQVWENNVVSEFYPWELCFGIRNINTSVYNNGYGISELEDLIQVVTWLLYGMQYNGNFFKQGSNPKGLLTVQGNLSDSSLNEFKQAWRSTIAGVQNAHKLPIISAQDEIKWIDMQHSNKDMEFGNWNDFLLILACSIYKIDPTELGFQLQKASSLFGQDGQKARLEHSQSKGLTPLLKFIQNKLNKFIVSQLDPNYEFVFTGVEQEDKIQSLDMDVKKSAAGFVSMEDMFKKYSNRDYNKDKDTILNQIMMQIKQQEAFGSQQSNEAVDQETGDESGNPFKQGADDQNPFTKGMNTWMESNIFNK